MNIESNSIELFTKFIRDLTKTYPEIKSALYREYSDCFDETIEKKYDNFPKIVKFLDSITSYSDLIVNKDEQLFIKNILLTEEVTFDKLWKKNITLKTRNIIWKYFQTFQIININRNSSSKLLDAINSIEESEKEESKITRTKSEEDIFLTDDTISSNSSGEETGVKTEDKKGQKVSEKMEQHPVEMEKKEKKKIDKKTAKELNDYKKLTENVNKSSSESELDDILGDLGDTKIGNIAKEVADKIDIDSMVEGISEDSDPMEVMAQLMNPEKMSSIFKNINEVMSEQVNNGNLSNESLKEEAETIFNSMSSNPLFSNAMNMMNQNMRK